MRLSACGPLAGGFLAMAFAAQAQTPPPVIEPARTVIDATAEPDQGPSPTPGSPLGEEALSQLTARQGTRTTTVLSDQDLTAVNHGNTITANTVGSGQVTIGANAFQGFAGVGNFVINSGHNNNLQGALTINVVSP